MHEMDPRDAKTIHTKAILQNHQINVHRIVVQRPKVECVVSESPSDVAIVSSTVRRLLVVRDGGGLLEKNLRRRSP